MWWGRYTLLDWVVGIPLITSNLPQLRVQKPANNPGETSCHHRQCMLFTYVVHRCPDFVIHYIVCPVVTAEKKSISVLMGSFESRASITRVILLPSSPGCRVCWWRPAARRQYLYLWLVRQNAGDHAYGEWPVLTAQQMPFWLRVNVPVLCASGYPANYCLI